jgi:hypothetical protein
MIAPAARYSGGSGFAILPGKTETAEEAKKRKLRALLKKRDAELVATLMLTEDLI